MMKKITIELDEQFASVLTISAIGNVKTQVNVTTCAVDIEKYNRIVVDDTGKVVFCDE